MVTVFASAKKTLDVQPYMLTTKDLIEPIKAAHERGVKVRVLMDSDNAVAQYQGMAIGRRIDTWPAADRAAACSPSLGNHTGQLARTRICCPPKKV